MSEGKGSRLVLSLEVTREEATILLEKRVVPESVAAALQANLDLFDQMSETPAQIVARLRRKPSAGLSTPPRPRKAPSRPTPPA